MANVIIGASRTLGVPRGQKTLMTKVRRKIESGFCFAVLKNILFFFVVNSIYKAYGGGNLELCIGVDFTLTHLFQPGIIVSWVSVMSPVKTVIMTSLEHMSQAFQQWESQGG